jgi:RHS repeat-associated protein
MTQDNLGDTYSYDAEGRQIKVNGNATTFDAFNRLAQIQSGSTYTQTLYSPNGQKFAYMNRTTLIKYIDPMVAGMKAVYNGSGLQYYRHSDWLGTNRFSATPSGTVYFDGAYAPYAENYAGIGTSDRVFTGQPMGTLPGLYDFTFREYGQSQGRWLVPDPAGLAAVDLTNPQTWNRYAYVGNNPLNAADPFGLYRDDCWWTGGCFGPGGPGAGGGGGGGYYGGGSPCSVDGIDVSCGSIGGLGGGALGVCPPNQPNCVIGANNQAYQNQWVPDPNGEPTGSWQLVPIGSASNVVFGGQNCDLTPITCMMNSRSFPAPAQLKKPDCTKGPCIKGPEPVKIGPQPKPFVPSAWSCILSPKDSGVPEVPGDPRVDAGQPGNPQMDFLSLIVDYLANAANCWRYKF